MLSNNSSKVEFGTYAAFMLLVINEAANRRLRGKVKHHPWLMEALEYFGATPRRRMGCGDPRLVETCETILSKQVTA